VELHVHSLARKYRIANYFSAEMSQIPDEIGGGGGGGEGDRGGPDTQTVPVPDPAGGNTSSSTATQPPKEIENTIGLNLGSTYKQCSTSRAAANTMTVTEIKDGVCQTAATGAPKIGSLDWPGDDSVLKTFHGSRISKNGKTVNESISSSFDPRNLTCMCCPDPHHVLVSNKPLVLIFSDQNFVSNLSGGDGNCIAVLRAENASLCELAELAIEVLDKHTLPPGSILIFGSASHLFRVGTSQYASDWINLTNRCSQKWKGTTVCPLIPTIRNSCPGSLARDISTLASWLGRVYAHSTTGLLDTWKYLLLIADSACSASPSLEIAKIPLPTSISLGSVQPHTFVYHSACPVNLNGMNRKATYNALKILITTLNRDFSTNLDTEKILAGNWANADPDTEGGEVGMDTSAPANSKHIVIIGASNMKRLVPLLLESGYTVTDLTRPSWIATPDNVARITELINTMDLSPGYTLIMELFGNSTFRYEQFDGTMALPFKTGNVYHMEGRIGVCEEDAFVRLVNNLDALLNVGKPDIKLFVPPLPRYLFTGCCNHKNHSTNLSDPDHADTLLASTMKFRSILKTALLKKGTDSFFVLDGIGSLIGIPPGGNRGSNKSVIPELEKITGKDGVHFTDTGYKNLTNAMVAAISGIQAGTLTKTKSSHLAAEGADSDAWSRRKEVFFWRGFSSPVGAQIPSKGPAALSTDYHYQEGGEQAGFNPGWRGRIASGGRGGRAARGDPGSRHLRGHGRGPYRGGRGNENAGMQPKYYHPYK
jgi:hypothetical protein